MIWLTDFFERGGPVLYAVLLTAVFLWVLICLRLWFFYIERKRFFEKLSGDWRLRSDRTSRNARYIRKAWIGRFYLEATRTMPLLATLIAICPLLGLLGTVTGMIQVFDVLSATGTGNARAMASGIAQATLPTMAGLVVALSGLYFRSRFQRLAERSQQELADRLPLSEELA
ncbi:MAG: biopolymer transporter ExbB [Oceanospirillaceae bacterium]|jgi:biopolymer transport protein ExbB|uniref:MotA/TolQ/ExbB proton channel family protein n=1 Tax=unclassified Thalassolituus TaxID=2624967 RepID=UPI000C0E6312|nr:MULTISPECIES: MotA/TolQ/ExbB proton channel family protein [unclassified Thalassolituus]MAG42709.1 biopolymer transporter ExbB [Oceanospirillaceae bacterium]MEC9410243.1 MotA/TolQ/ExbB proton channel family protein [Pseudomonadota bacterium]MBN58513.1 biopolymer transporter ExbB [Oceanospirillaceae bacterium]MDQ4423845.1 MotA/TolQ/ExbB proton channel family protein [Thalassolituus sp.]MDQ4425626.1 MotA/TolQ/ExbB proton channel family protein [Thalassolituus sp.]|tara:strand:+ start:2999 stop:3514 length:516 start_codon:yes stop_codon:yes gene_type:complete